MRGSWAWGRECYGNDASREVGGIVVSTVF